MTFYVAQPEKKKEKDSPKSKQILDDYDSAKELVTGIVKEELERFFKSMVEEPPKRKPGRPKGSKTIFRRAEPREKRRAKKNKESTKEKRQGVTGEEESRLG